MAARYDARYFEPTLRELWDYNPETGIFTSKIRTWGQGKIINVGDEIGHVSRGYIVLAHRGKNYLAHVVAWVWMTGKLPAKTREIDHENTIRNDNRWINLRLLSHGGNMSNLSKPRSDNTAGITGVYKNSAGNWFARIQVDNEIVHLGTYPNREGAIAARKKAEAIYWQMQAEDTF